MNLLKQASYVQYAGTADNSPSAHLLRMVIALASAMNALGYTHNQPALPPSEWPHSHQLPTEGE